MVHGLELFREWFNDYSAQYLLIGGTAATLAMEDAGLPFRATKDLDVVLLAEDLSPAFGEAFWNFIRAGGYEIRQSGATGKPSYYRFQKPADPAFPVMVELFSRAPDPLHPVAAGHLTPISFDGEVSSLSAILLDDTYYRFLVAGKRITSGVPCVGPDRLIALKAIAWLELTARKQGGEPVDAKQVRKHANDILRLAQLFTAASQLALDERIARDIRSFLKAARADSSLDPRALGLGPADLAETLDRIASFYRLFDGLLGDSVATTPKSV